MTGVMIDGCSVCRSRMLVPRLIFMSQGNGEVKFSI